MSVEPRPGGGYKVRWRQDGQNRARSFQTRAAADKFDRRVKDLKASGELHLLDERPKGTTTLGSYALGTWWPNYVAERLAAETQSVYAVQLELRIIPRWGRVPLLAIAPGPLEEWVAELGRGPDAVGDATIIKTVTVMRSILARARRDGEIDRNPAEGIAKPKQQRARQPTPITPLQVERLRAYVLDPPERRDKRGWRIPARPELLRLMDATLISVLGYCGPRPESEALPLGWDQVGRRTITLRATKSGVVVERPVDLLPQLAQDLREWRARAGIHQELVFPTPAGEPWAGHDWDNWRDRVFQPAAEAVGLPAGTIPRDLRGSFATLLIYEGRPITDIAEQLGHSPTTCMNEYLRVFKEFDLADRKPAEQHIREARERVAQLGWESAGDPGVPAVYPAGLEGGA